jgi:hypothetical protein
MDSHRALLSARHGACSQSGLRFAVPSSYFLLKFFVAAAKLRTDLQNGIPFWVNPEQDLVTWRKPPELRDFLYAQGKLEYQKQRWSVAYEKFQDILTVGNGEDWHHTKRYQEVCLKHLQHQQLKTDASQVYDDAKHLYEEGQYVHAETAFNFVLEIMELGPKDNFHHTREYLKKCKQMLKKEAAAAEELAKREGHVIASDQHRVLHYYTTRLPLGISQKVRLPTCKTPLHNTRTDTGRLCMSP